jgi:foldase protein PrsA
MLKIKIPPKVKKVFTKKRIIIGSSVILIIIALYFGKSLLFAAWVNGKPIYRLSLIQELERQGGQQVLDNLIDKSLVEAEAKKGEISITNTEVENEIKNIEEVVKGQGMTLEEALKFRNQTVDDLRVQIRFQKLVEKILGPKITVTDAEIKEYFNTNKSTFPAGSTLEKMQEQIKAAIFQEKLSTEYTNWITEIKTNAKLKYFVSF